MIYRMETPNSAIHRWSFYTKWQQKRPGNEKDRMIDSWDYKDMLEELACSDPSSKCRIYKAPILAEWYMDVACEITHGKDPLPDIFTSGDETLVSERAKAVIETVDPFSHQFHPSPIVDTRGRVLSNQLPFYCMNMRRVVSFSLEDLPLQQTDFWERDDEKLFLPTIQHNPDVRSRVEELPIWRHLEDSYIHMSRLYMNQDLVSRLHEAGVIGVREYTAQFGKSRWECLAHV